MPRVLVDLLSYTGTKGGMETYARELYRALGPIASDYEFIGYMSSEGYHLDRSWFPGRTIDSGISGEKRVIWALGELFAVSRAATRHGADLIHSPALLGPMKSRVPTVITMHDLLYFSHPELMTTGIYTGPVKWMEKRTSRNAARILTISQASPAIETYLGVDPDRIDLVPLAGTRAPGADRSLASSGADDPRHRQPPTPQELGRPDPGVEAGGTGQAASTRHHRKSRRRPAATDRRRTPPRGAGSSSRAGSPQRRWSTCTRPRRSWPCPRSATDSACRRSRR